MRRSRIQVFEELAQHAMLRAVCSDDAVTVRLCLERGNEIPDRLLPGRMIMKMTDADRELLKTSTAADFQHRIFG